MLQEIDGDLVEMALAGHFDAIIHGCNCKCTMGAGIAAKIAKEFPSAKEADDSTRYLYDSKLGHFSVANIIFDDRRILVFNAYTQVYPGRDLREQALTSSLRMIAHLLNPSMRIGIPKIGCGIAGGDWAHIGKIVEECFADNNITVVNYRSN